MSAEGLQVETMAITTLEDAVQAVERGLASCYGLDGGRPWVGFGECARGGQQSERSCEVFLQIPASDNAVKACQRVQQSYVDRMRVGVEHDGGTGPRDASDATIEAELRRACAAYEVLSDVEIEYGDGALIAYGSACKPDADTYEALRRQSELIANGLASRAKAERRRQPCGVCRGYRTLLCHACKGGVGT